MINGNLLRSAIGKDEVPNDAPISPGSPEELTCKSGPLAYSRDASLRNKQEEDKTTDSLKSDCQQNPLFVGDCHNEGRRKSMVLLLFLFI